MGGPQTRDQNTHFEVDTLGKINRLCFSDHVIVQVACGNHFTCARPRGSGLLSWGDNARLQLGFAGDE